MTEINCLAAVAFDQVQPVLMVVADDDARGPEQSCRRGSAAPDGAGAGDVDGGSARTIACPAGSRCGGCRPRRRSESRRSLRGEPANSIHAQRRSGAGVRSRRRTADCPHDGGQRSGSRARWARGHRLLFVAAGRTVHRQSGNSVSMRRSARPTDGPAGTRHGG